MATIVENLRSRLPSQRAPPDPFVEQANAADLTYGWHSADSDKSSVSSSSTDADTAAEEEQEPVRDAGPTPPTQAEEREAEEFLRKQQEMAICRICFEGVGSQGEDGKDLGRLLSPCKCKGTMKYIHSSCLDTWRRFSSRSSSAVACDQCGAPYRFKKSRFVGLASSKPLLFAVSIGLFILLIWVVGAVASLSMQSWIRDDPAAAPTTWRSGGSSYDDWYGWQYETSYSGAVSWFTVMKQAVRSVVSGDSADALRQVVGVDQDGNERARRRSRYDARQARPVNLGRSAFRPAWLDTLLFQLSLGFSLVGISSFIHIIFSFSFFSPLNLNLGMGRGLARMTRRRGGNAGAGGGGDATSTITSLILLLLVVVGIARALWAVYSLVQRYSRRMLARAEDYIVDWRGEEVEEIPPEEELADAPVVG